MEYHAAIAAFVPSGIIIIDLSGKQVYVNRAACEMLGYSEKELKEMTPPFPYWAPEEIENTTKAFQTAVREKAPSGRFELLFRKKNEQRINVILQGSALKGAEGETKGFVASITDITEHKETEEELKHKTEDLLLVRALANAINLGEDLDKVFKILSNETGKIYTGSGATVYLISQDKKHLIMQRATLRESVANIVGRILRGKIPPVKIALTKDSMYGRILGSGEPHLSQDPETIQTLMAECTQSEVLKKLVPKVYRALNIRSVISVPLVSSGEPIGLVDISRDRPFLEQDLQRFAGIAADLTPLIKRKMIEDSLMESEARVRSITDNIPFCIYEIDRDHEITFVNRTQRGVRRERVVGTLATHWFPSNLQSRIQRVIVEVFHSARMQSFEYSGPNSRGEIRDFSVSVLPIIFNGRTNTVILMKEDITERKAAKERLEQLSITDSLTGLLNHAEFYRRLNDEILRCQRYGLAMSLLMLDLDNFKAVNDRYGHQTGDIVLSAVASIIKKTIRPIDKAARYGGEEFTVILPETELAGALTIAERIRKTIETTPIPLDSEMIASVRVSIGAVSYEKDAADPSKLVKLADSALYTAKEAGRNQVRHLRPAA